MKKPRASIADRVEADALNREWDAYVRSVGRPPIGLMTGTSAAMRDLHRLDDAPAPDPGFLSMTWQQLRERVPVSDAPPDHPFRANVLPRCLRWRTFGGNRRSPSVRVAVAALGVAFFALTLFAGRLLPAGGDAPLVASALASERPAAGSFGDRNATSPPHTVVPSLRASSPRAHPASPPTGVPARTATPTTPTR